MNGAPSRTEHPTVSATTLKSNLLRPIYSVLGVPIDAITLPSVIDAIEAAAATRSPLLISTPNLNFVVTSRSDPEFRESLLDSDLCTPDGMPIVWIARFLGLPFKDRVAGADILEKLRSPRKDAPPLRIYLFGGAEGVAAEATKALNREPSGLRCVGTMYPGFGTVEELSQEHMIETINNSNADFLVLSLGATKGQLWLHRNHKRLRVPLRAHLGAAINFQAGTTKRAPAKMRASGFEWLWRIKEEPHLWRRYWNDGCVLLLLLLTRILPLLSVTLWNRLRSPQRLRDLLIETSQDTHTMTIYLSGGAIEGNVNSAALCFCAAMRAHLDIIIDLSNTRFIDARFFGLLLALRKELKIYGHRLKVRGGSKAINRLFRLNELAFLLHE
jgi:N-acetylglucosaminyldiphosphoundecaprenol N-acetyl-beta-D-mannosaminyltransferase